MSREGYWFICSILAFAGTACSDTVYGPPRYTLSGTVLDSVTGRPVQAATVTVEGETAASDSLGDFKLPADSGVVELLIQHPDYEARAETIQLAESRLLEFGLRRLAPYVRDYLSVAPASGSEPGLETALVADLQGNANVDTTRGELLLWFGSAPFTAPLSNDDENVEWVHTDSLTIQVVVWLAPGLGSRDSVQWTLYDADGHSAMWLCNPRAGDLKCQERN